MKCPGEGGVWSKDGDLTECSFPLSGAFDKFVLHRGRAVFKIVVKPGESRLRSMANANGRTQHCWSVLLGPTCCVRLNGTTMLALVAYSLKPVKSVCMGLKVTVQFDFEQYFWLMEHISVIS